MFRLDERLGLNFLNLPFVSGAKAVALDVAYGVEPRHRLDVYAPAAASSAPVVIFLHGGGWETGAKEDDRFVMGGLVGRGFVAITLNYGLYPAVRYPVFLEDAAMAVAWAKDHARGFGGDPARVVLLGHSAGAYIAAMLSLDVRWLGGVGLDPASDIAAAIGLAGPYDFLPLRSPSLKAIFGPPESWPQTQPMAYVTGKRPFMLLATGDNDDAVDPANTSRLVNKIRQSGGGVQTIVYPGLSHRGILAALAWPLRFLAPVLDDIAGFVARRCPPTSDQP
ncbi:esterase/lipase/thioesterase family protein [Methylocella silvestris BL2]|uniref:Esterase/lipase/thioesterase family protein n=1 Tax=Methylocella silvestris (strain DSM 15510 / CIP 108128 / LMG 27833 / NCIMB 13906 / BL2) TaxID=395965 RepID=B8EPW2_METSB|nr:alpha/beta hydrolase [Methylocella silvestris]ACK50966.1 esterase/lipase/thioesterase family protein [Methylocella silvestris BL2]